MGCISTSGENLDNFLSFSPWRTGPWRTRPWRTGSVATRVRGEQGLWRTRSVANTSWRIRLGERVCGEQGLCPHAGGGAREDCLLATERKSNDFIALH